MSPGGAVAILAWGGGVSWVGYQLWRISRDNRRLQRDIAEAHAREARQQRRAQTRLREAADLLRVCDVTDDELEEEAACAEARFLGWLADNPEIAQMFAAICSLPTVEPRRSIS